MIVEKHLHIDLIKKVKQGSYEDFTRLYFMYADLLYGFVLNLTKSPDDAEDILQETFLRIWQTKENLSLETSFKSYLYTIAHNLIIDSFRKKIDSVAFEVYIQSDAYQNYTENNTENEVYFDEFLDKLNEAKKKLSSRQLVIFELSREKGCSIKDIAEKMGVSEKTVKNQLTLALKTLKSELSLVQYLLLVLLLVRNEF